MYTHLGGERHCESKASWPRTQPSVLGQGSKLDRLILSGGERTHRDATANSFKRAYYKKKNYMVVLCFQNDELFVRRYEWYLYHKYHISWKYLILCSFKAVFNSR